MNIYRENKELVRLSEVGKITAATVRNPLAETAKAELLDQSRNLETVGNERGQEIAIELLQKVEAALKSVEKSRKEAKEPFADVAKAIDQAAKDFSSDLEVEKTRLKKMLADFQIMLDRKRQEQERLARQEQERLEAEKRRIEEEAEKRRHELERQQANARSEAEAQRIEQMRREADEKAAIEKANLEMKQAEMIAIETKKPEGILVKRPWKIEVVDVVELYRHRPDMVELHPKQAELNKLVAGESGIRELPGCRIWQEVSVSASAR